MNNQNQNQQNQTQEPDIKIYKVFNTFNSTLINSKRSINKIIYERKYILKRILKKYIEYKFYNIPINENNIYLLKDIFKRFNFDLILFINNDYNFIEIKETIKDPSKDYKNILNINDTPLKKRYKHNIKLMTPEEKRIFFNRAERDRRREKTKQDFNFIFNYKYNNNIYKLNFKDIYIFNLYIKKIRL